MGTISCDGKRRPLVPGKTLFDYADELAVLVPTSCGRSGRCRECVVEVKEGMEALGPRAEAESFLLGSFRLACQAVVEKADADVWFAPLRRRVKILTATQDKPVECDPAVTRRGDTVYYDGEVLDRYRGRLYGLAIDLGTMTVVVEVVDLETGESVCVCSFENPQRFGGSDVMHRISYDRGPLRGELHRAIVRALNHEILRMSRQFGFSRREVYEVVVAGNSTMRDLFFNRDVQSIGVRPYKSAVELDYLAGRRPTTALLQGALSLGLRVHPGARVYGLPLIGSHVGADVAADLLAIDMEGRRETVMMVDVGTNTEVVVGHAGRMVAASCPAGPAFEGGLVKYGMPAYEGAIESIRWRDGRWDCRTIGEGEPRGFCGSGLIDLLAELRRHGWMMARGGFAGKARELAIVPEHGITFSREDASYLAQAKAANYCGQFILLRRLGVRPAEVSALYLAGGFANAVNVRHAIEIGFLAPVAEERVVPIGNAALQGAREALLSRRRRRSIETLVRRIEHVELESTPDFFEVFVDGCQFRPMPAEEAAYAAPQTR